MVADQLAFMWSEVLICSSKAPDLFDICSRLGQINEPSCHGGWRSGKLFVTWSLIKWDVTMSAFFFGQVSHHTSDRKTKNLSCSLSIGLDFSGLSSHVDALNRHAVLYSLRQMMISSTDTTINSKSAFLRHTVWRLAHSLWWTFTHIWTLMPSPYMFTYCGSRPSFIQFLVNITAQTKEVFFFLFSNSLHSFLAARSIYSKYSKTIPMASRNGLLHIVSPQKSPSVQENGLHLAIQIIQGSLSNFPVAQYMWTPECLSSHAPPPT